jgi:ribosomal protein L34
MKYEPPEDKRHTVHGWKTRARNEYVKHQLRKRKEHGFAQHAPLHDFGKK